MRMHMPVLTEIENAAREALLQTARDVLAESKRRVPVDDGDLRKSGRVTPDRDGLEVRVRYVSPIAWLQHERLDYRHPRGGEAKYLENAIDALNVGELVAGNVEAVLKRGRR